MYGKIVRIFDESTVAINIGGKDGVKRGDRFAVVEKGGELRGPDSGESLGELEIIKAELTAYDVLEKYSILVTDPEQQIEQSLPLSSRMVQASLKTSFSPRARTKMDVLPGDISGKPSVSPVRIGDYVRRLE